MMKQEAQIVYHLSVFLLFCSNRVVPPTPIKYEYDHDHGGNRRIAAALNHTRIISDQDEKNENGQDQVILGSKSTVFLVVPSQVKRIYLCEFQQ